MLRLPTFILAGGVGNISYTYDHIKQNYESVIRTSIFQILQALGAVFAVAGIFLMVYSIFAFIMALKNEDPDAKVTATTQMGIALFCISMDATINILFGILK